MLEPGDHHGLVPALFELTHWRKPVDPGQGDDRQLFVADRHPAELLEPPHRVLRPGTLPMALRGVARITSGRPLPSTPQVQLAGQPARLRPPASGCSRRVPGLDKPEPSKEGASCWLSCPGGGAMDLPADQSTPTSALPVHSTLREAVRSPRRRRPTGAPPPLPYRLQTSGVGWLVAAVVLVGLELAVFGRGLRGAAVAVTVADDAVVRWLGGLHAPGLEALWQGLANVGSWWTLMVLWIGLVLALVVLRRWSAWPGSRWARTPPATCSWPWASGSRSRCCCFAGSPPARCSRSPTGGAAAPTWTWVVSEGSRSAEALRINSAYWSRRSGRSGWPARAGPPPCGSPSRASRPPTCSPSSTRWAICALTAGTSSAASCCTAGSRTKSRSTACGGWCSRRTTPCR